MFPDTLSTNAAKLVEATILKADNSPLGWDYNMMKFRKSGKNRDDENTQSRERLNALPMLSIKRDLVLNMHDFNENIIDRFAALEEKRAKFQYQ